MFFTRDLIFCRTVGEGSFGRVVKVSAKHSIDNLKYFALKLIKKDSINSQDYVNSLMNEIKIFGEVNGEPFFPRLYDTFYAADRFCFLTDFCEGGELLSLIHKTNGFSLQQIKFYGAEILLALGSLHDKNIIYRDLKSENVLLTRDGHIKLVDFGLSIKTTSLVNDRVGTIECMAPEVLKKSNYGKEADFWSFGILLYEMFHKETPFSDDRIDKIENKIFFKELDTSKIECPIFADLLCQLLHKKRDNRLGYKHGIAEIMKHPFFTEVNWKMIQDMSIHPPIDSDKYLSAENYPIYRESIYNLLS